MHSLQHEIAFKTAQAIVGMVAQCLREEEQVELFSMVYDALMDALKLYEERAERRMRRIHPGRN